MAARAPFSPSPVGAALVAARTPFSPSPVGAALVAARAPFSPPPVGAALVAPRRRGRARIPPQPPISPQPPSPISPPSTPPSHLPHIPLQNTSPKNTPSHRRETAPHPRARKPASRARNPLPGPTCDPYNGAQPAPNGLSHPSVIPVKTGIPPSAAPYGPN